MPNEYPTRFLQLLADLPPDAVVLDCGAGGRRMPDRRVIALEYARHPCNDVQGDALRLPFRDGCFDLVLSQAVLEHVTDPALAVREMSRVLRPGGVLYAEAAFIQPVHMAPHHYFNVTPHGMRWLGEQAGLEVLEQGTVGSLEGTLNWIALVGDVHIDFKLNGEPAFGRMPLVASGVTMVAKKSWTAAPQDGTMFS